MFRRTVYYFKRPVEVLRRAGGFPHFDLCIIGGGPAGYAAAMRAANLKKRVCIVEANQFGGTELHNGAMQSKALWEIAKFLSRINDTTFGGRLMGPDAVQKVLSSVSTERIASALKAVSEVRQKQYEETLKVAGVNLIAGKAMFSSENEVDIHTESTGEYRTLSSDYFIVATGSRPREYPLFPTDHRHVINSDDLYQLPIPKSMVIIGAGASGCETASIFANLGKTKIYLIDKAARVLPREDEDVAMSVQESLVRRGVTIHHDCKLFDLETPRPGSEATGCRYSVQNRVTGAVETFNVERAVVSIGRSPFYNDLGLENTKMRVHNGVLAVDPYNRCLPYKHVYCIHDVGTVSMARAAAEAAVSDMYIENSTRPTHAEELRSSSSVLFLDEELASVGLNEMQCRAKQIGYIVAKCSYKYLSRAIIMDDTDGFVKLLVTNDREKRVLGVRASGPHSGSVVEVVSLAIRNNASVYELQKLAPAYPSVVQCLVECIRMTVGRGLLPTNLVPGVSLTHWSPSNNQRGRAYRQEGDKAN